MKMMSREELLRFQLDALKREHRRLDTEVARITATSPIPPLELQRLKKKKLSLRDQIEHLRDVIHPDIIA